MVWHAIQEPLAQDRRQYSNIPQFTALLTMYSQRTYVVNKHKCCQLRVVGHLDEEIDTKI